MPSSAAIARFKARGSARDGVGHWKLQRLTAMGNLFLLLWLVVFSVSQAGAGALELRAALANPFNTTAVVLLVVSTFWHARLGVQVVLEDYVHHEGIKFASLIALNLVVVALAVTCLVAALRIALGS